MEIGNSLFVIRFSLSVKGSSTNMVLFLADHSNKTSVWSSGVKFHGKLLYVIPLILSNLKAGTFVEFVLFTL